jgi:hypothetical protein
MNVVLVRASAREFVCDLHSNERVRTEAKRLFEADRHVSGKARMAIQQIAHGSATDAQMLGNRRYTKAIGFDDVSPQPRPRMDGERVVKLNRHQ